MLACGIFRSEKSNSYLGSEDNLYIKRHNPIPSHIILTPNKQSITCKLIK